MAAPAQPAGAHTSLSHSRRDGVGERWTTVRRWTDPFNQIIGIGCTVADSEAGSDPLRPISWARLDTQKLLPLDARAGLLQCRCHMTYEDFLEHAEECERLAEMARLPSNRHALLSAG